MGKSGKLFKALVTSIKALKSPSREKRNKDKSTMKVDRKDHVKKGNKEKCLWSLGKSSSQNRDTLASAAAFVYPPEIKSTQFENKHVSCTDRSVTSTTGHQPEDFVMAEHASSAGCDSMVLVKQEELAAIKIQAVYRRHLVLQRASRSLRAVVRLQALARGQIVRKQAAAALRSMQALIKVQALARGHRVRYSELGQLIQKHLQQTRQQRKKPGEGLVSSMGTSQQLRPKAQSKQDAIMKRQRALVYAFSEQLNRCTLRQNSSSVSDFQPDKSDWAWVWLERWMAAHPWGNLPSEQDNKDETVKIKADNEVNAESCDEDIASLIEPVGNSNTERASSNDFVGDYVSNEQERPSATETEAMSCRVRGKEEPMLIPTSLERAKTEDISANGISAIKKVASRSLPSPPPPPPPPPLHAKRANPVGAHRTSSHEGQQAVHAEMPGASEFPHLTSLARAAELLVQPTTGTPATHLKSSRVVETHSPNFPSSPLKNSIPLTSANQPIEAFTIQNAFQSYPESPLCDNLSASVISSAIPEMDEISLTECDMASASIPMPSTSDSAPNSPSEPPTSSTAISQVVLPLQKHAIICSPLSMSDDAYVDDLSNRDHTFEKNGLAIKGNCTMLAVEPMHGCKVDVTVDQAENGSMDLKNELVEADMDIEVSEDIEFKTDDVIQADFPSEANRGCDASVASTGEKFIDVSPSKHTSPVSKYGQHTQAVSPSVPNYMTTTKSSQAKVRTLPSPVQKLDSPKQKADSPKPRFDSSKRKIDSPKQKLGCPKQELDSPKQKIDSPKQRADLTTRRRHSLSALEGKVAPRSSLHIQASSKGHVASLKDTCAENSSCLNADARKRGKPVVV